MFFRKRPKVPSLGDDPESPQSRSSAPPGSAVPSILGQNTRFRGEVRGRGPLIVRGHLEGSVSLEDRIIIERGGVVDAEIRAGDLVVGGLARGEMQARGTLSLRSGGVLEGRVSAGRLRVEEGARVNGTVSRAEKES